VLPYFKRIERRIGDADASVRGREGLLAVTDLDWRHPLCEAFIEAAVSLGIPRNSDYNGAVQEGVAYAQRTIHRGRRVSAATSYLRPAAKRANLTVRTEAHATAILFEGKRAIGVRYLRGGPGGAPAQVRASREVILSGGAYNSPQLLQLSGIGPAPLLQSLGVEVKHELPVGEGLQDHYAPRTVARVKNATTINERVRGLLLAAEVANWVFRRKGILTLSPTIVYAFWHSGETPESCDLQVTFTPASYKEGEIGRLEDEPGMTVASWQQRPESRGYVRACSADPFVAPIIQSNYLDHPTDRRVVVAGMKLARQLLATPPMQRYYAHEDFPGPHVQTDDELLDAATRRAQTTFHPCSTCRMGPATDRNTVVDDQLRVHGMERLRIVDASVMPRITTANLNASTLMIAEKAADIIRQRPAPDA
jgi:choline dehydrogenase